MVAFKERYQAEKFMFSPWKNPNAGDAQLSWLPNLPVAAPAATESSDAKNENGNGLPDEDSDTVMQSAPAVNAVPPPRNEMDYDVAEDDGW